jgi:heat shock protein HtpX
MAKRIFLFVLTNLAVMATVTLILQLLSAAGYLRAGRGDIVSLAIVCLVWGMVGSFISLQMSRFIAKRSLGVRLIDGNTGNADFDWLHNTVGNLARQANIPMPEVGIYESPEVNAFATGPSKRRSLVAVATGALRSMGKGELEGVLGHEISHVANGDMVTMTLIQGVMNAFVLFFARILGSIIEQALSGRRDSDRGPSFLYFIIVQVLQVALGVLAMIVIAWFSRQRELRADAGGAELAGRGSMISALRRLLTVQNAVVASTPALDTLKINGGKAGLARLWMTHPPLEDRIARLEGRA